MDVKATCTTVGIKSHHCSRCDEITDITEMSATDHDYDDELDAICNSCGEEREIQMTEKPTENIDDSTEKDTQTNISNNIN